MLHVQVRQSMVCPDVRSIIHSLLKLVDYLCTDVQIMLYLSFKTKSTNQPKKMIVCNGYDGSN